MLLDTSGLLCICHRSETGHQEAVEQFSAAFHMLTHSFVLAEFVALAQRRRVPRSFALDYLQEIQDNPTIEMIHVNETLYDEAAGLLRRRLDKEWSLCDAVSFVLMDTYGISEALTTDHHFEQAGFVRLLKL